MNHSVRAVFLALAGFAFWVFSDTCIKLAGQAQFPPSEIIAFMGFAGMLLVFGKVLACREVFKLKPVNWRSHGIRAFIFLIVNFCNAIAVKHLSLSLFYTLIFLSPMVVALMGAGILKEHLNRGQVLAIAVGFAGVVLAINPWAGELQGERIGYIVMIGSVVCFSSNVIVSRFLMRTETPESLLLVASCSQFIVGTLLTLGHGTFVPFTGSWSVLGGVGLFNMVGTAFYLLALRDAKAATVSSFHYSQLVFGAILGYLIWGDVPTLSMALGAMVIAASGFYVAHQVKRTG